MYHSLDNEKGVVNVSEDWWEHETDVEDVKPSNLPVKPKKLELDTVEKYRMPDRITSAWVKAQLTASEWRDIKRTQKSLKLNPEMIESMYQDARKGLAKRAIMARHGLHVSTWARWESKAELGEQPYALWHIAMVHAWTSIEEQELQKIREAGHTDWKASKWILEQINKEEYQPTPKNQVVNVHGDVHAEQTEQSVNYFTNEKALQVANIMKQIGAIPSDEIVDAEVVNATDDD